MLQQIDWSKLGRLEYWFEGIAGSVSITAPVEYKSSFFWWFLWIFTLIFSFGVSALLARSFIHKDHPLQSKLSFWGNSVLSVGVLGAIWFMLRQLSVGFLGARFWLLIFLVWAFVLIFLVVRYFVKSFGIEYLYFKHTTKDQPLQ
jgi:hypothetical protein